MSNCCTEEQLLDLVVGELTQAEADAVLAHTRECEACRQLQADFKFSVSFFQNRLGDIPDMPKQLSQHHFKEIITTARELEAELPNLWGKQAVTAAEPVESEHWGRTIALSIAAVLAIALGIAVFVQRPWESNPPQIVEIEPNTPDTPEPEPVAPEVVPPKVVPEPDPVKVVVTPEPKPDPKPEVKPEPTPDPVKIVVVPEPKPEPKPEVTPEPKPEPVVEKPLVAITIYDMSRNRLPRHLKSTPGKPGDSGLSFTSTGYVRKISALEAKKYQTTTKPNVKDERELFELEYKTDERSANRLIDVNEQIMMAGGVGARNMRFKPRSSILEVIGNRQELMTIHQVQEFLCDDSRSAINLSLHETDVPTQQVSKHRPGVLFMYQGRPVDAKQLASEIPSSVMRKIKSDKIKVAVAHRIAQKEEALSKLEESGTGGSTTGKKDVKIGKDGGKRKGKGRSMNKSTPSTSSYSVKPDKRSPHRNSGNWFVNNTGGAVDWQERSDILEETPVKVELTDDDFGGISQKTVDALKAKTISKKQYTNYTYNRIMESLCKRAGVRLIDLSDQSETKLSVKLARLSIYDAIEELCQAVDVQVMYTAQGVILSSHPAAGTMQTAIFKLGTDKISLRQALQQSKDPKQLLTGRGVRFPDGAGVSVSRVQNELIIHNTEAELREAIRRLDLGRWD